MIAFDLFADRTGTVRAELPYAVEVESYGAHVLGGSEFMEAHGPASPHDARETLEALANRVDVRGPDNRVLWSGLIRLVELSEAKRHARRNLDNVFNAFKVLYRYEDAGTGETVSGETAWVTDADSILRFGRREFIASASDLRPEAATLYAQTLLRQFAWPELEYLFDAAGPGAHFTAYGWAQTLAWKHYRRIGGKEEHTESNGAVRIGQSSRSATTIGFLAVDGDSYLYDLGAALPAWGVGDRIVTSGLAINNGTFRLKRRKADETSDDRAASSTSARTLTATTIGFESVLGARHLFDMAGGLQTIEDGEVVEISGAADPINNGPKRVERNLRRAVRVLDISDGTDRIKIWHSSETISYLQDMDGLGRLALFEPDDMLRIEGADQPANNGYGRVTGVSHDGNFLGIERELVTEGPAAHLILTAGNTLLLNDGSVTEEAPTNSITVKAGQYVMVEQEVTTEYSGFSVTVRPYAERLAQSFQLAPEDVGNWYAWTVNIKVRRIGQPTDNLRVKLCSDAAGTPGTVLAQATVDGDTGMATTLAYLSPALDLGSTAEVEAATTYHLVVERSGSADAANCYSVGIDEEARYSRGLLRLQRGASWETFVPLSDSLTADMPFSLMGSLPIATILAEVVTQTGQFITALELDASVTAHVAAYRPDYERGRAVLESLLAIGDHDGRRLCYEVTPDQRLRIFSEPLPGSRDYTVDTALALADAEGNPVAFYRPVAGVHAVLRNGVAPYGNMAVTDPARTFIEQSEVDVRSQSLRLKTRKLPTLGATP